MGSSPVAEAVSLRCRSQNKRCVALGGAKNHLVALPDCDVRATSSDVVVSFAGCAGQRCMAASVLLLVGDKEAHRTLLEEVVRKAGEIRPGTGPGQMGPVIDRRSLDKIKGYIDRSEKDGAEILLDGRTWIDDSKHAGGCWIGPTVVRHAHRADPAMNEEVFGPLLSVYRVDTWQEAIQIENASPYGNAAAVYTAHGGNADWFLRRFRASVSVSRRPDPPTVPCRLFSTRLASRSHPSHRCSE